MIISEIVIKNFRCFEELKITLHDRLTVLTAPNGGGKTAILDAIRISLWPYVKGFDLGSQSGKPAIIQIDDVRLQKVSRSMEPQLEASVEAYGDWSIVFENNQSKCRWKQMRDSIKLGSQTKEDRSTKAITNTAKKWQGIIRAGKRDEDGLEFSLPLVVYLGTGRLWYQGRHTFEVDNSDLDISTRSRLWAYQNCLTATSSYKQFEHWFAWIFRSYRELQIEALEKGGTDNSLLVDFKNAIDVVQTAINTLTEEETGWSNLQYRASQNQQLVMEHKQHGYVPLNQLSDGLRNMVVMISEIAFRCYQLNPHLGRNAALRTTGCVLIDEVDMFLHPAWQQRIISALQEAFPYMQFVLTTHSPQVLTTVSAECIRILEAGTVYGAPPGSKGAESSRLLKRIFDVEPRPQNDENTKILKRYEQLVYEDKWSNEEAIALRQRLDEIFAGEEPKITELDLYIENRIWEREIEKDQ